MRQWGLQIKNLKGSSLLAVAGAMALVVGTAACGGGGGGSADSTVTVGGVVADGLIKGAVVTAKDANGSSCKTATTGDDGSYSMNLPTSCVPATLSASGGTDQMTGQTSDLVLESLVTSTTQTEANVNPQSTLMTYAILDGAGGSLTTLAQKTDTELSTLLTGTSSKVMAVFGFGADVDSTYNPMTTKISSLSNNGIQAVLRANEAAGETFRRAVSSTGNANVSSASVQSLMQNFGRDLSDGSLDGVGATTNVAAQTIGNYNMASMRTFINTQAATVAGEVLAGSLTRNVIQTNGAGLAVGATVNDANFTTMLNRTNNAQFTAIVPSLGALPVPSTFIQQAQTNISAASAAATALGANAGQVANFTNLNLLFGALAPNVPPSSSAAYITQNAITPLNTAVTGTQNAVQAVMPPTAPPPVATIGAVNTAMEAAVLTQQQSFSFQVLQNSTKTVTLTDYNAAGTASTQTLCPTVTADVMTANVSTALSAANLTKVYGGTGTAPTINFTLNSNSLGIPKGRGVATVTASLLDGTNATRDAGERALTATTNYNWSSDGTTILLEAPAGGVAAVSYFTVTNSTTTPATTSLTNTEADVLTVTSAGPSSPQILKLKVASLFSRISALSGAGASGNYFYKVKIEGIPLALNISAQVPAGCQSPGASTSLFRTVQGTISAQ